MVLRNTVNYYVTLKKARNSLNNEIRPPQEIAKLILQCIISHPMVRSEQLLCDLKGCFPGEIIENSVNVVMASPSIQEVPFFSRDFLIYWSLTSCKFSRGSLQLSRPV